MGNGHTWKCDISEIYLTQSININNSSCMRNLKYKKFKKQNKNIDNRIARWFISGVVSKSGGRGNMEEGE